MKWIVLGLFTMLCRIGEASNPGPYEPQIGCINPNGILGKCNIINQLPQSNATIWAISESHLTAPGKTKFQKELKAQKCNLQAQLGAEVAPKSETISAIGGKQLGVGFLSNLPCRSMTRAWDEDQWKGCRVHASCFQVGARWIQGGVIYGYASQPTTLETRQKTNGLAQLLDDRLVNHSKGLRFIAGDFNQDNGQIECMTKWADEGWVNIQVWATQKFGTPITPTCHGKTVKDHVFVSPELAMYLKTVQVDNTFFADHACLWATFHDLGSPPMIPFWKQPSKIQWEKIAQSKTTQMAKDEHALAGLEALSPTPAVCVNSRGQSESDDKTEEYANIARLFEEVVDNQLRDLDLEPLQNHQKGRGQTREVKWIQEYEVPPKQGREGDFQPLFHGTDLKHAQWIRQLRRCTNIAAISNKECAIDSHKSTHRDFLWQSILRAKGFGMSFSRWWKMKNCKSLPELPGPPPDSHDSMVIVDQMKKQVQNLEEYLLKTRVKQAKLRRQTDANAIFQDLRDDAPQPVQMLVNDSQSKVVHIDAENIAVELDPPCQWKEEQPVSIGQSQHNLIHAEPDKLWVHNVDQVQVGDRVLQDEYIGELSQLFHQFGEQWSARWDRHIHTDDSYWEPIIAVATQVLDPPPHMSYNPISYDEWTSALRRKKKRSAVGPDGYAKEDLLNMPRWLTDRLLQMLTDIEHGATWPIQAVTGFVVSLEKTKNAKRVDQYRPITLFSLVFRTWGSIRSRQVLRHLSLIAPQTCTGNLPNKRTNDVWYGIQSQIEESIYEGRPLCGAVIDLVKAFNMLPRIPVLTTMIHLNVAGPIIRGWTNALTTMKRRFKIRQAVGPPLGSTTGFAEGDGLSVTAMLCVNLICHAWCKARFPSVTLWSYVDNIEITSPTAESAIESLHGLERFAALMDVQIDTDKTYLWSTDAECRRTIRQADFAIRQYARDLGGHVQYNLKVTNSTVTAKIAKMGPLWNKLSRSLAGYGQKVRACRAKAWPRCLHAVEIVHLADEHYEALRTGLMKALAANKSGASPIIHLSLIEATKTDPQFYALVSTVLTFRQYMTVETASFVLGEIHQDLRQRPRPGPCAVMLSRLQQIGWDWSHEAVFKDHMMRPIDIFTCPVQEVVIRLQQGWQDRIKGIAGLRKSFQGLHMASVELTMMGWQKLSAEDQAIMRVCLNGSFFTADHLRHNKQANSSGACQHCGMQDSQKHRHWECPAFTSCRQHLNQSDIDQIVEMQPSLYNHGWMPEPPSLRKFQSLCCSIPDATEQFLPIELLDDELYLFSDGGCLAPTSKSGKLAMWGVAVGSLQQDSIQPLSNGLVPGMLQTTVRAEATAVVSVCKFIAKVNQPFSLVIDNDLVFRRTKRYLRSPTGVPANQKDADLWTEMAIRLQQIKHLCRNVIKIVSHQDEAAAETEAERWLIRGNNAADSTATSALQTYPQIVHQWQQYHADVKQINIFREAVRKVLLQVGRQAVMSRPSKKADKADSQPAARPRFVQSDLQCVQFPGSVDPQVPLRYRVEGLEQFLAWFQTLEDPTCEPILVTWFHLNLLYERQQRALGFRYSPSSKRWKQVKSETTYLNFVSRTNHFSRFVQGLFEVLSLSCKVFHLRPQSVALPFWTQCLRMRLKTALHNLAEQTFMEHASHFASVRALRALE